MPVDDTRPEAEHPALGVGALAGAATIFSWGFVLVKLMGLPGPTIASARLGIGVSFLALVFWRLRVPWPTNLRPVVVAGLFFGAHQLLYIAATQLTSIAIVTLMGALQPLLVTLVSRRAVGEPVPRSFLLWGALATAGVAAVVLANQRHESRSLLGDALAVLNLIVFVGYFLAAKRSRLEGAHTVAFTAIAQGVAALVVLPGLLLGGGVMPAPWQWGLIALLALGPGNGHLLVNWAHRRVSAALASLILSAVPLLASLWAHLVFDEPYGWPQLLGMALVIGAIEGGRRTEAVAARARKAGVR